MYTANEFSLFCLLISFTDWSIQLNLINVIYKKSGISAAYATEFFDMVSRNSSIYVAYCDITKALIHMYMPAPLWRFIKSSECV